jgi:hypothetical protein
MVMGLSEAKWHQPEIIGGAVILGREGSGRESKIRYVRETTCRRVGNGRYTLAYDLERQGGYFFCLIARSTSRLASRALMVSRRSYCFFPLANASSTFAWPRLEK